MQWVINVYLKPNEGKEEKKFKNTDLDRQDGKKLAST